MIKELLQAAGIQAKESRYQDAPDTHAVYFDDIETDGPDGLNWIKYHNGTVELYAPTIKASTAAEARFEAQLDAEGLSYTKQPHYWLKDIQRYQTVYEFTIIEKGGHENV